MLSRGEPGEERTPLLSTSSSPSRDNYAALIPTTDSAPTNMILSDANASTMSQPKIVDEFVLLPQKTRARLALAQNGVSRLDVGDLENGGERPLLIDFKDTVGVTRDGATLTFVSYPKIMGSSVACCINGEEKRIRTEVSLDCAVEDIAKRWEEAIWRVLLGEFYGRTGRFKRRFLVLLNPKSGKGHSEAIFQNQCLPMFRDACIECTLVKTEYSGHARKVCQESADLATKYDGIVIVSGDGLMFEVIQGVMARADWANVLKNVPFGIVPGGSGNGLAVSLAHASGERRGPESNSFLIAKGLVAPMDLCAVDHFGKGRMYSFLSMEFGFIADIDIGSEWMRHLGEVRFTLQAILLLFNPISTRCRFSYVPVQGSPVSPLSAPTIPSYWDNPDAFTGESGPRTTFLPPLSSPLSAGWNSVEENYYLMWHANVSWMSSTSHVSPHSRWNDGYTQLCYYQKRRGNAARWNILRYLLALETGAHINEDGSSKLRDITMFPTRAFRFEPLKKTSTRLAIDGESVEVGPIQLEVLPGIALLMGTAPGSD